MTPARAGAIAKIRRPNINEILIICNSELVRPGSFAGESRTMLKWTTRPRQEMWQLITHTPLPLNRVHKHAWKVKSTRKPARRGNHARHPQASRSGAGGPGVVRSRGASEPDGG